MLTYVLVGVVVTVPAPLVGGAISLLLSRKRIPQFFYFVVLASTLAAGAVVPRIYFAPFRHAAEVRDRLEGEGVPALLKRIYEAEMSYSAGHPDKLFTCDASQLPGPELKALPWHHYDYDCNSCTRTDHLLNVRRENYEIMLYCPNPASPHNFRVTACPSVSRSKPVFSVDESGQLVQIESGDPARKKVVCDDAGDEVRILGASPPPGTTVPGDQPSVFHLDILYSLAADDSASLVMSVAQFPESSTGCSRSGSLYQSDSVEIPIVYGEHTLKAEVTWSGDTGQKTGGRVFGKGFVGFAPSIRGAHPAYLSVDPEYCYAFGR